MKRQTVENLEISCFIFQLSQSRSEFDGSLNVIGRLVAHQGQSESILLPVDRHLSVDGTIGTFVQPVKRDPAESIERSNE